VNRNATADRDKSTVWTTVDSDLYSKKMKKPFLLSSSYELPQAAPSFSIQTLLGIYFPVKEISACGTNFPFSFEV
jgi:hypothetical protein